MDLADRRARKPAVAWVLGDRSWATAQRLWQQLPAHWHGPRCWYFAFDNLRLALSQTNVRSTIQRQARMQKFVFLTSMWAGFSTLIP